MFYQASNTAVTKAQILETIIILATLTIIKNLMFGVSDKFYTKQKMGNGKNLRINALEVRTIILN